MTKQKVMITPEGVNRIDFTPEEEKLASHLETKFR